MTRPSDRAIAQAFAEFQEATIAVPVGHYDDTKGSSTYNWRRSFESAVLARATELDATAAPVVVGEVTDAMVERACRAMVKAGGMYDPDMPVIDMDNKPTVYWRHFIRDATACLAAALAGD